MSSSSSNSSSRLHLAALFATLWLKAQALSEVEEEEVVMSEKENIVHFLRTGFYDKLGGGGGGGGGGGDTGDPEGRDGGGAVA